MCRARFWRCTAQDSCALGAAGAWAGGGSGFTATGAGGMASLSASIAGDESLPNISRSQSGTDEGGAGGVYSA